MCVHVSNAHMGMCFLGNGEKQPDHLPGSAFSAQQLPPPNPELSSSPSPPLTSADHNGPRRLKYYKRFMTARKENSLTPLNSRLNSISFHCVLNDGLFFFYLHLYPSTNFYQSQRFFLNYKSLGLWNSLQTLSILDQNFYYSDKLMLTLKSNWGQIVCTLLLYLMN